MGTSSTPNPFPSGPGKFPSEILLSRICLLLFSSLESLKSRGSVVVLFLIFSREFIVVFPGLVAACSDQPKAKSQ